MLRGHPARKVEIIAVIACRNLASIAPWLCADSRPRIHCTRILLGRASIHANVATDPFVDAALGAL